MRDGKWIALALAAWLAGCATPTPTPPVRPAVEVPERWRVDIAAGEAADVANTAWWRLFGDPVLEQLIDQALQGNPDLLIAAARIEQFMAQLAVTNSQLQPQLGYGASLAGTRSSAVGVPPLPAGADPYHLLYQASVSAQWQLDLFGRVRRQSEAVQARLYASEQGRRGVVLSLATAVAASYVALRGLDRQLEVARAAAANAAASQRILDLRFRGGVASRIQLEQVQSQYQLALAAIPRLEQQVAAQENLISGLLGRNPGPIARGKTLDQLTVPLIPSDLPAALLQRRPDILQAEQNVLAANADLDAARLQYYPTLTLTGALGTVSGSLGHFLSLPSSLAASVAAGLAGPIFTGGAIEARVQGAEAAQREAVAAYRKTVLNALREANDALAGTRHKRETAQAQTRRVQALREYARLAQLRVDAGYADYLEVLYAQNELFTAELGAVGALIEVHAQVVDVYRAVGGGWVDEAARRAPAAQAVRR